MASIDGSVKNAYENVRKKDGDSWTVLGYEGNKITVQASGSGNVSEAVNHFQDNAAQYAYVRFEVPQAGEEGTRTKFVLISWVGESTPALKKGKVSVDKPSLKAVIRDLTLEFATSDKEDLTEEKLLEKIRKANY